MVSECTSCGSQISSTTRCYKCRQCANHVVCPSCFRKDHNRASLSYHTMVKIEPVVRIVTPVAYILTPPSRAASSSASSSLSKYGGTQSSSKTSSTIFTSRDYLTQFLGYCNHCLKVIVGGKDELFTCDQCTGESYDVCKQCLLLMPTHHVTTHTFSKKVSASELVQLASNLNHFDTKCGTCLTKDFKGTRYRSKKGAGGSDYCEHCAEKARKQVTLKIIPHPFLLANNKYRLARRALKYIDQSSHTRDPLTGWTRDYAETVVDKSVREQTTYGKQLTLVLPPKEESATSATDADWQTAKRGLELLRQLIDQHITYRDRRSQGGN